MKVKCWDDFTSDDGSAVASPIRPRSAPLRRQAASEGRPCFVPSAARRRGAPLGRTRLVSVARSDASDR
jgi:hypothetical protein